MWVGDGHVDDVLLQTSGNVCGPCCVGMVTNLLRRKQLSFEEIVRKAEGIISGSWSKAGADRFYMEALLKRCGIKVTRTETTLAAVKSALRESTLRTPRVALVGVAPDIAGFKRERRVYHWVVFIHRQTNGLGRASTYTVLDPISPIRRQITGSERYVSEVRGRPKGTQQAFASQSGPYECVICCE